MAARFCESTTQERPLMNDQEFTNVVCEESLELLQTLERTVLELEVVPTDLSLVGKIFRIVHTIKGSAGMVAFDRIRDFAHHLETALDQVRSGLLPVSKPLLDLILAAGDHLREQFIAPPAGNSEQEQNSAKILAQLAALSPAPARSTSPAAGGARAPKPPAAAAPTATAAPAGGYHIHLVPFPSFLANKGAIDTLLGELATHGTVTLLKEEEGPEVFWDILLTTSEELDAIHDLFIFVANDCRLTITAVADDSASSVPDHRRLGEILVARGDLSENQLHRILAQQQPLGELLVAEGVVSSAKVTSALATQKLLDDQRQQNLQGQPQDSIRVSSAKLDRQVNLICELVVVQSRLNQLAAEGEVAELQKNMQILERLTAEIRDNVLDLRMLPVGTLFSKFKRLVRDLATELGKEVEMVTAGADTELDKSVLDQLGEPLIHLIRNSIDHGLEAPAERSMAGKSTPGILRLTATHTGAHVVIKVEDDGRGLDPGKIRATAMVKGLLAAEQTLTPNELFQMIFIAGVSTATTVTNVSGRGVGMDVVKTTIEGQLRGTVEVESKHGQGTAVTITLPLTLAIIDGLLVRAATTHFVLPFAQIEGCLELTNQESAKNQQRQLYPYKNQLVPYVRLREFFALPGPPPEIEHLVIVAFGNQKYGFILDQIIGSHQTVIKSLGWVFRQAEGVSGATILGNGEVALIIDIAGVVALTS